ncbi:MAG: ABC transporter substrate-binding protein [Betaproteobacteria bacterium]|jgi:branched-chain amino acid transport system substrate-binding protein|nr:MAG: ABC transporter substrate-binding protein [Betaproteobacteria bacterium]
MRKGLLVLLASMALVIVGCSKSDDADEKVTGGFIRIGVLTDLSGLYSDIGGQGSIVAAELAVEDLGGEVAGFPIEVISVDHQNKADIAAQKVREWIDRNGVDMVTDALNSAVALATAKVVAEKKKIMMNTGAASTRLTNEDCTAYTIHHTYDTFSLANGTGTAVVKQGGDTWFFLTSDYAFGHSLETDTAGIVRKSGGEVLGAVRHPLSASDFSSFLLQAQNSKAKIIGLANAGGDTINAIKAANEFGITREQNLAGLLVFITDIHSLGLPVTQGMYVTSGWYWNLNDETRAWSKRFFDRMGKMPTMINAGVYSSIMMYANAVEATETDDADVIMGWLRDNPQSDMFGKNMTLRKDGRLLHDMYLMQVKKPEESQAEWDYYHVRETIPAAEAFQPPDESRCPLVTGTSQ